MKTCDLCGARSHEGPCYAELKEEWHAQYLDREYKRRIDNLSRKVLKVEAGWLRKEVERVAKLHRSIDAAWRGLMTL